MTEQGKEAVEELKKQLRLAMNIDDVATTIRNGYAQIILNLIEKLQKENEELKNENDELNKELNEENKRCMMLAVEKQDYLEKHQYHLKQNESLTKEFSDYIPKQKIKDKIEEINKMIAREQNDAVIIQLGKQKRVLQKLLESEE
nr:MAG TPA: hypothetical protein [Caudoviricetes sp.]